MVRSIRSDVGFVLGKRIVLPETGDVEWIDGHRTIPHELVFVCSETGTVMDSGA